MIVRRGAFPPCLTSSSSCSSRSRGSYAILLPPSNADPACDVDALRLGEDECLLVGVALFSLRPHASPSSSGWVEDAPTRRRERPPVEAMWGGRSVYVEEGEERGEEDGADGESVGASIMMHDEHAVHGCAGGSRQCPSDFFLDHHVSLGRLLCSVPRVNYSPTPVVFLVNCVLHGLPRHSLPFTLALPPRAWPSYRQSQLRPSCYRPRCVAPNVEEFRVRGE